MVAVSCPLKHVSLAQLALHAQETVPVLTTVYPQAWLPALATSRTRTARQFVNVILDTEVLIVD